MNVTRRPATEEDTELARGIHHAALRDVVERQFGHWDDVAQDRYFEGDWREAQFEMILADGVPCGYVCIEDRAADVHLREIVIAPEFQGRGIGTAIVREVIERARNRGVPARLGALHQNRALALYRRLGFRDVGRTDTHIGLEWRPI